MGNILTWNDNGKMRIYTENGVVVVLISIYKGNGVIVITMKSVDEKTNLDKDKNAVIADAREWGEEVNGEQKKYECR